MKIQLKVFLVALIFAIILGVLASSQIFFIFSFDLYQEMYIIFSFIFSMIRIIISPVLVFLIFYYYIGKGLETAKDFWQYIFSLFLGNVIGYTISRSVLFVLYPLVTPFAEINFIGLFSNILSYFAVSVFSYTFFVGFCALATSFIVRKPWLNRSISDDS